MISSACNAWISNSDSFLNFMRFVLLKHSPPAGGSRLAHLDLMLQTRTTECANDPCLMTFEIPLAASQWEDILLKQLPHHRFAYLDYTGEISGNRGYVERVDAGRLEWVTLSETLLEFALWSSSGDSLHHNGLWRFSRSSDPDWWTTMRLQ